MKSVSIMAHQTLTGVATKVVALRGRPWHYRLQHHDSQKVADAAIVAGSAIVSYQRTLNIYINVLR